MIKKEEILKLNILENAIDYLNCAIEFLSKSKNDKSQHASKFALINIAISVELFLKERLRREHPLFVYSSNNKFRPITRETKTVSWDILIERLQYILDGKFAKMDSGRLKLAQSLRNQMIHYDVELKHPQVYHDFANILNFIVRFYEEYLTTNKDDSLKNKIDENLWWEVDELYGVFERDIVYYNYQFLNLDIVEYIESFQKITKVLSNGKIYDRIRYGSPLEWDESDLSYAEYNCHDCGVIKGQFHTENCDMERCPICLGQYISCGCTKEYIIE